MLYDTFSFRRSVLAIAISLACASGTTTAAVINVGGGCTLINAINNANADADTDGPKGCRAGSGADTINLERNKVYRLKAVDNTTDGPNGLPSFTSVVTINGNHATVARTDSDGTPKFRLFHVAENGSLTLKSLVIKNGQNLHHDFPGGGIFNSGTLTVIDSVVSQNRAFYGGGGIANTGTLTLTNTTVSGNESEGYEDRYGDYYGGKGGGIFNNGKAIVTASILSENYVEGDGGVS